MTETLAFCILVMLGILALVLADIADTMRRRRTPRWDEFHCPPPIPTARPMTGMDGDSPPTDFDG